MGEKWAYFLRELGREHNDMVGKKCANLGEMTRVGLSVPLGFALCLDAYTLFMEKTGLYDEMRKVIRGRAGSIDTIDGMRELSLELRRLVEDAPMPPDMEAEIASRYRELCERSGLPDVAVSTRSAGAVSRPGQYETHLNVSGVADVMEKVKKVWSSTFNATSLSFRKQKGIPLENEPIGVAILTMVNARVAGIIFTAEPNSGDNSRLIIEANWGLGESVVGGESMPDTYIVDRETLQVVERRLGTKLRCVLPAEKGVCEQVTSADRASVFCLSDAEASEIARIGVRLEEHFNAPQDAEWAIDMDLTFPDNIIWLQTRNVVLAKKKEPMDQLLDMMTSFVKV